MLQPGTVVVFGAVAFAAPQLLALFLPLEDVDAVVAEHATLDAVEQTRAIPLVILQRH